MIRDDGMASTFSTFFSPIGNASANLKSGPFPSSTFHVERTI